MSESFESSDGQYGHEGADSLVGGSAERVDEVVEIGFDQWLNGAAGTQRSVEVLQDGTLAAMWDTWVRKYKRAKQSADETDNPDEMYKNPGQEISLLGLLEAEGKELLDRIDHARTTWYVTGLQDDVEQELFEELPIPKNTVPKYLKRYPVLAPNANAAQSDAFLKARDLYQAGLEEHNEKFADQIRKQSQATAKVLYARAYKKIARAFVKATNNQGQVLFTKVSPQNIAQLHKVLGDAFFNPIITAITEITEQATPIPGESDFLSILSGTDQD